jgi:hypothetical protein
LVAQGEVPQEVGARIITSGQCTSATIDFGNGVVKNSTNGFTVYTVSGDYIITGTATGPGGSNTATLNFTAVEPPPPPPAQEEPTPEEVDPNINSLIQLVAETGTFTGGSGGTDPEPPAPYVSAGGGGASTGCVLAGTIIKTARGDVPVEQVTTEDLVYSYNFDKEEFSYYKIEKAWSKKQPTRVFVETESGKSVECSDTHLFYHPDYKNQEICVKNLTVGDIIYTVDDDENVIEDPIRNIVTYDEEVEVYNFEIPDIYSYITNDIVSHNLQKVEQDSVNPYQQPYEMTLASPETEVFEIEADTLTFNRHMLGGELVIYPVTGSTTMVTDNEGVTSEKRYLITQLPEIRTKIKRLKTNQIIIPDMQGMIVQNRLNAHKGTLFSEYQDFGPSLFTMSYQKPVTASFRVVNKLSYAKINLNQLRTYSGDVSKVKVFYKAAGDIGGFQLLTEQPLESKDQLVDSSVSFGKTKIGYFAEQLHINHYWFSRQGFNAGYYGGYDSADATYGWGTPTASLAYTNDVYVDTMKISGSNKPHDHVVGLFHRYPMKLVAGTEYSIRMKIAGYKKTKQLNQKEANAIGASFPSAITEAAKLRFFISGSGLRSATAKGWGVELGHVALENSVSESFDTIEHNFVSNANGDARLQLVAESGEWYISDLSVKPMRESGFSPDYTGLVVPTPQLPMRDIPIEFYAEFVDFNNNKSQMFAIGSSAENFVGSSVLIEREDNTVSGSFFFGGDVEGGGIEAHGGSAYMRNVGYVGYYSASLPKSPDDSTRGKAGFMFWSGSVLTDITDEYSAGDVGLELHGGPGVKTGAAGALRFRSSTGKLEVTGSIVATDGHFAQNFGVGTGSAAIEISSSRKIMKTKNWTGPSSNTGWAISGSGQAYFQEGYIGGWNIKTIDVGGAQERAVISGSNITLDAGGAAIYMSNRGPATDNSTEAQNFPVRANEYYIDFTPTSSEAITSADYYVKFGPNFSVDKTGVLFASGAVFEGTITASAGLIGGWAIEEDRLTATSNAMMLSGSGVISSSMFYVDEVGNLTASSGHFIGTVTASRVESEEGAISGWQLAPGYMADSDDLFRLQPKGPYVISSSNFQVDTAGNITGSSTLLGGSLTVTGTGTIAGFGLTSTAISSSDNSLILKSTGQITASAVDLSGKITATGGEIGGFAVTTTAISSSNDALILKSSGQMTASSVDLSGKITATTGEIGGFQISATSIYSSNNNLILNNNGQITGSSVLFTGGDIAGWTIASDKFSAGSGGTYIALIPGTGIQMGHGTFGSAPFSVTNAGVLKATSGTIGGFTLGASTLSATNFTIDASNKYIALGVDNDLFLADADTGIQLGNTVFGSAPFSVTKAGVLKATSGTIGGWNLATDKFYTGTDSDYIALIPGTGIQMGDSTFDDAPFSVTNVGYLKSTSGEIGGWGITSTAISSSNLIIHSSGRMETANFASGLKGWRISAVDNGSAEFEEVTIRGTLKTAVFEKESVNAVGGQLYVANSTTITGSGTVSASNATMSVVNVTGFAQNEVLSAKKVSNTGFATEYILVQSASRDDPASEDNYSGKLFVTRGYSGGTSGDSGSLGDSPSTAQDFEPGQVIVSTGKIDTGFIRLNANPNDSATPYIDIVERTGSGVYDIELKARLGDLSGLSQARLHGTDPASAGFGLYSQNVFLEGGIVANTGSIAGVSMQDNTLFIGAGNYNNTDTEFYINGNNGTMSLKDKFVWDGDDLSINGSITLGAGSNASAGLPAGTVSGSAQLAADISGSQAAFSSSAASSINTAVSDAADAASDASDAQNTANAASSSAGTALVNASAASSSAGTALVNASSAIQNAQTAQDAIDTMETRVVLDASGMELRKLNGYKVAKYGSTTYFYDGSDSEVVKLQLQAAGVKAYGDDTDTYSYVWEKGMQIVSSSVEVGSFGATTTIGNTSSEHVEVTSTGLKLKDGTTVRLSMDSSGMQIGSVGNGITLNSSGTATFNGSITIGPSNISATLASNISGSSTANASAAQTAAELTAANALSPVSDVSNAASSSAGNALVDAADAASDASDAQNSANAASSSAGTALVNAGNAQNSANTALTNASASQAAIDTMETRVVLDNDGMELQKLNGYKVAKYGSTSYFYDGTDSEVVKLKLQQAGVTAYGDDANTYSTMTSAGLTIFNDGTEAAPTTAGSVAHYGANTRIGGLGDNDSRLEIDSSGNLSIINRQIDGSTVDTTLISLSADGSAAIAGAVTIGGTAATTVVSQAGSANQDSTSAIQSGTTAANVGLDQVGNYTPENQIQQSIGSAGGGTTITGGGIIFNAGGVLKTINKDSSTDTTAGFFLGREGSYYTFGIGDATNSLVYDGNGSLAITGAITATSGTFTGTINAAGGVFTGYVQAGSGNMRFGPNVSSTNDGLWVDANNYWYTTAQGGIKASDGTIGGWTLGTTTLTGGSNILLDQGGSKIQIADDVTSVTEGITISYGSAALSTSTGGVVETADKCHIIAGTDTDLAMNVDYGNDLYLTSGRLRQWYVHPGGGGGSDPSADGIGGTWLGGTEGTCGPRRYDAGIMGISSNLGGNLADNEVNASVIGSNSRGAGGAACAGVFGIVNRGHVAGIVGECIGGSTGDKSDWQENNTAGIFRGGPLIAGNPWTGSAGSEPSNTNNDYCFIAYPRTKFGATHENRVGINVRAPSHALHVDGNIYATGNVTAYSDIRSKKNIEFISGSLNLINQLRGVRFEWKKPEEIAPDRYNKTLVDNPLGVQIGMIAQEVQKVLPELVEEDHQDGKLSLKYQNLVSVLVNAVNELTDKVNEQEKQIKELQNG